MRSRRCAQDLWWIGFARLLTLTLVHTVALLENRRSYATLTTLLTVDPVTALPNNRAILATIEREVPGSNRAGQPLALLFVSFDHAQTLDERHGYAARDELAYRPSLVYLDALYAERATSQPAAITWNKPDQPSIYQDMASLLTIGSPYRDLSPAMRTVTTVYNRHTPCN
jgi:hypothetical protein